MVCGEVLCDGVVGQEVEGGVLAAGVDGGQEFLGLSGDEEDEGVGCGLFECLEECVLPDGVDAFGFVDDEDLGVVELGFARDGFDEVCAEDVDGDVEEFS